MKKTIRKLFNNIRYSAFINHISFLWHWKNFIFLLKYPFYRSYNRFTGKFCGYAFTEYDCIPCGWRKAFGKQLSKDILKAGKKSRKRLHKHYSWKKLLLWEQIKEKWGGLRLYASATDEIDDVLNHYENISTQYCIECGKKAEYVTSGWIEYLCEECFDKDLKRYKGISKEEMAQIKKESKIN